MVDPASDSFPNLLQKLSSFDLPLYCHYCASSRNDDGRDTQRPFLSVERISHLTTHTTQHYRIGTLFISELNLTHSSHFHGWHLYNSAASCAKSYFCLVKAVSLRIASGLFSLHVLCEAHLYLQERSALFHPSLRS